MPDTVVIVEGDDAFYRFATKEEIEVPRELRDAAQDIADRVVEVARGLAPKRTRLLATEGIGSDVVLITPDTIRIVAGLREHPEYGIFVHEGTGIEGPLHHEIFTHHGNVMHWRHDGREIFARSSRGQRPHPFVREAILLVEGTYVPARIAVLAEEVSR